MNIYLVSQEENDSYNTHDSFVCYAETKEKAKQLDPDGNVYFKDSQCWGEYGDWCSHPDKAKVKLIGSSPRKKKNTIICSSFNAG